MLPIPSEFGPILLTVFCISLALTASFFTFAKHAQLMPTVRDRDVHTRPKPRIGGVAMWGALLIAILLVSGSSHWSHFLQFGNQSFWGIDRAVLGVLAGMLVILITGLLDDLRGLSAFVQLGGQALAGLCLALAGVGVRYIQLPLNYQLRLDSIQLHLGGTEIWLWSAIFTIGWVIAMINVINFFDGLDGLAGSVSLTAAAVLIFISLRLGLPATAALSVILVGIIAGFLPLNWHPSRIFMGTVGSQLLGFMLATIAIISGGKMATAILVLGIPLFDALIVIARRLMDGVSPFKADQRHLHHRLLKLGLSVPVVVVLVNIIAIFFGVLAYSTQQSNTKGLLTLLLLIGILLIIWLTYRLEKKQAAR
jgi:UDP-GlcNAc:undecaprenyl-phosphate GlcNAc-1-phosphate transferase